MSRIRFAARALADHWILVLAVVVNLAIAMPLGAARWNNDVCGTEDGYLEDCCTMCTFFCSCEFPEDDPDGGEEVQ